MMKKRTQKLISVLLSLVMLLSLLPTTALAADSRTVISNVAAKSEGGEIAPKYDTATASPTITVTTGDPAYFYDAYGWQKYNGTKFETYYGNTFTEGKYRYDVQVRIDGESGLTHVLEKGPGLTVTVDNIPWTVENVQVFDNCCWANVHSPEFVVKMPVGQALTFHDSDEFNIGENYVNNAINPYSVAANAKGGTAPYTFSKVSGPAWISVSPEGDISGTPTAAGSNENLVVKVTDSVGAEKTITIAVADTKVDPDDRAKVSAFAATTPGGDITPVCGAPTADNPVFTVTAGSPAYCSTIMCGWRKYDGERYVDCEDTFAADTYYYYMQVRIDEKSGLTHVLDKSGLTVTVDGKAWLVDSIHVFDDCSWANVYSPAFVVTEGSAPAANPITSVTLSDVTAPVIGEKPDFDVALTTGVTLNEDPDAIYWYKYDPENDDWDEIGKDTPFGTGTYRLEVWLAAEDGYEFTEATKFYFGEKKLPEYCDAGDGESCYYYYDKEIADFYIYFKIDEPAATPIESVTLSGVTEPSVGATPDFDIILTATGAELDDDDSDAPIRWYKYDSELDDWELLDEDTRFGAGIYGLDIYLKAKSGYKFTEDTKFFFDENELPEEGNSEEYESCYYNYNDEVYADFYIYFKIDEPAATPITSVTLSDVTAPVIGAMPDFGVTLTGNGVALYEYDEEDGEAIGWEKYNPETGFFDPIDKNTAFEAGLYFLYVDLQPEEGYAFTNTTKFYYNDDELPAFDDIDGGPASNYELWGEGAGIYLYFTLKESAAPNETYTVSFDANGGEGTMANVTGISGEYILPANGFTAPDGKQFKGWAISPDGAVISGTSIGVSANTTLYAIWEDIPAAPTATIVVMKCDSNKQPLAGATFTLTQLGNSQPDYTAVSDANGLVTFTGVADGSYTLAESEAPAGYIKDNATWTFNVRNGVVSDNDGTPYNNSDPLRIANEPALAPELPDIVVWKTDGGQNYIAGATFTLTKEREITPAYTATSDENGKVLFEDVADGIYILAESESPAGYIKTDVTYKFLVEYGEVSLYEDDDPVAYEDREPITIANLPVPELPDIVVWKTDGGQNYIAGATFTLTKERETSAAYTATSDENGKVLFEGVADGIYILAETAAPAGYIPTDVTYKFLVEYGEVSLYEDDDPVAYEDQLSIANEPVVTVTLPITKVVAKGGTVAPGQQTFTFEIKEFGNSNYDVSLATILENTITTNGVGSYEGVLQFTLTGNDVEDILSEGLIIVEKNDGATNWTYDTKEWTVYANNAATSGEQWSFLNDDIAPNGAERATFTNTYTKNASSSGGGGGSSSGGSGSSGGSSGSSSSSNKPVLNKEDHMAFLQGYADGTFRPEKNMTRAQVTVMFARLLVEKMEVGKTYSNSFSDVPADYWAANEIGYMEKFGIINGFNDGTFRPNDPVTRAQFAAIACRFEELTEGTKTFSDVPADHWAAKYISYAAERGWVGGFTDGTFRPNNYITRAQVAAVTCRLLERNADENYIKANLDKLNTYSDMTEAHFAYWYALEASNGHDYTKKADKETWSNLLK